jgi:hypothetical protein
VVGRDKTCSVLGEQIFVYIAYCSYARGWVGKVVCDDSTLQTYATCVWFSTFKELFF